MYSPRGVARFRSDGDGHRLIMPGKVVNLYKDEMTNLETAT